MGKITGEALKVVFLSQAQLLAEMDEEFGVGDLVSESFQEEKRRVGASVVCMYKATTCSSLVLPVLSGVLIS